MENNMFIGKKTSHGPVMGNIDWKYSHGFETSFKWIYCIACGFRQYWLYDVSHTETECIMSCSDCDMNLDDEDYYEDAMVKWMSGYLNWFHFLSVLTWFEVDDVWVKVYLNSAFL